MELPDCWAVGGVEDVEADVAGGYWVALFGIVGTDFVALHKCPPFVIIFVLQFEFPDSVEFLADLDAVEGCRFAEVDFEPDLLCAGVCRPTCGWVVVYGLVGAVRGRVLKDVGGGCLLACGQRVGGEDTRGNLACRAVEGQLYDGVDFAGGRVCDGDFDAVVGLVEAEGAASQQDGAGYLSGDGGEGQRIAGPGQDVDVDCVVFVCACAPGA